MSLVYIGCFGIVEGVSLRDTFSINPIIIIIIILNCKKCLPSI